MKKKNLVVITLMSVLTLVFAVSCFLLVRGISRFSKEEKILDRSVRSLRNYYARNPFPSADNVKRLQANSNALREWMAALAGALREGQIEPIQKTPAQFLRLFSQTRDDLQTLAQQTGTELGEDFDMGFERYSASGSLPAPADVPRLAQELVITEQILQAVFEGGATSVTSLRREEFESSAAATDARTARTRSSRRGRGVRTVTRTASAAGARAWKIAPDAGVLQEGDLYARLRFGVTFEVREDALLKIMNRLAAHDMFAVVSLLEIEKTAGEVNPPASAATDAAAGAALMAGGAPEHPPRSQRLMSGPMLEQPMQVTMEIDVYRFAELTSGKEA